MTTLAYLFAAACGLNLFLGVRFVVSGAFATWEPWSRRAVECAVGAFMLAAAVLLFAVAVSVR